MATLTTTLTYVLLVVSFGCVYLTVKHTSTLGKLVNLMNKPFSQSLFYYTLINLLFIGWLFNPSLIEMLNPIGILGILGVIYFLLVMIHVRKTPISGKSHFLAWIGSAGILIAIIAIFYQMV